ncbi:NAD(P)/FAD-dependent oxidoreductase [Aquimarina intermedia]|uniref:Glycine/D-amino acid oxidase-like deaminating enzyme n=1 Tax=Aquimarina intermedia TaxID=350814 RepID=A0A5S5CH08_9FLAO|nr:FAD-dependent oxidoreductase [Aquimarina intermedia]TYP77303.1 glycine/D-amino acid oxidase-like deaminating enzyme [Aquimarina intermedia]
MLDYILVGLGLSGLAFAEQLAQEGKTFKVYENYSQKSSRVAGGLFNPVVLKRFTPAWGAYEHMKTAIPFYKKLEETLDYKIVYDLPVLRRFNSVEEQNLWFEACDKPILSSLLSPELLKNTNTAIYAPFHYGKVNNTGRIAIKGLLKKYLDKLRDSAMLVEESFEYDSLQFNTSGVVYNGLQAKHIVFAEGFGVHKNPFFNHLPIPGNKGEYLIVESTELQLETAIKASIFIIPLGNNLYKVGATYNPNDKTETITVSSRKIIEDKLKVFLKSNYRIIDQEAGIRPTVPDRKPILGTHPDHNAIHILNGLGSRGILTGPTVAKQLYRHIEYNEPLDPLLSIDRFN